MNDTEKEEAENLLGKPLADALSDCEMVVEGNKISWKRKNARINRYVQIYPVKNDDSPGKEPPG